MAEFKPEFISIDYFVNNSFLGKGGKRGFPGFLKPNKYGVRFVLPTDNTIDFSETINNIQDFLSDNIISIDIPGFVMGDSPAPLSQILERRVTGDISVQFYEDASMSVRNAMWEWMNATIKHKSDTDNFERKYIDDIKGKIEVIPILHDGNMAPRMDVFDYVYPVSIGPTSYNIGDENSVGKIPVQFKYRYHNIEER